MAKSNTLVMKFGGTSVGSIDAINKAANIVKKFRSDWDNIVVVVSAMSGVTDMLLVAARNAVDGKHDEVRKTYQELRKIHISVIEKLIDCHELRIMN